MKTTDEFTIAFAKWIFKNQYKYHPDYWYILFEDGKFTSEELLNKFKDETNRTRQKRNQIFS